MSRLSELYHDLVSWFPQLRPALRGLSNTVPANYAPCGAWTPGRLDSNPVSGSLLLAATADRGQDAAFARSRAAAIACLRRAVIIGRFVA